MQALLRARPEEAAGRLEPVLAAAVGRSRWLLAGVTVAVTGTAGIMTLTGVAGVLGHGIASGQWSDALAYLPAALVQIPAALAVGGVVVAVFGVLPRWAAALGWTALAGSLVIGQFGGLLELPQAVLDLSPFTHVPAVPLESLRIPPLLALTAVTAALTAAGLAAFRRRDLLT